MQPFDSTRLLDLFRDVIVINNVVGNAAKPTRETATHQISKIIQPEAKELRDGLAANDRHEVRDGIADVLFTLAGLFGRMGLSLERVEELLHEPDYEQLEPGATALECLDRIDSHLKALLTIINGDVDVGNIVFRGVAISAICWTLRLADLEKVDAIPDLRAVVESNWTKFDVTQEAAMLTRDKYNLMGVDTFYIRTLKNEDEGSPLYVTFSALDQTGVDGKSYPKGKWLKSINFMDTDFRALPVG